MVLVTAGNVHFYLLNTNTLYIYTHVQFIQYTLCNILLVPLQLTSFRCINPSKYLQKNLNSAEHHTSHVYIIQYLQFFKINPSYVAIMSL